MKRRRLLFRPAVLGLIALGALLAYRRFFFDWEGRPSCHKALELAVRIRMSEQKSNLYPNASGSSRGSIDLLKEFLSFPMDHYRYVPGLRPDDPGELVLFYFDQPTRWIWHGPAPSIFSEKAWIVVPADFANGSRPLRGGGELSERIPEDEFRRRLQSTLDFVKTNARPNWEAVVAEHTRFLEALPHAQK